MKKWLIVMLTSSVLMACAHQELEAPCSFKDRNYCGPKLVLEKVIV